MYSCLYEGHVRHARYIPVKHAFSYSLFFVYLDLMEVDHVFQNRWLWSTQGFNIAYLRRKDHFGDPSFPLDQAVRDLVHKKTGKPAAGPVRMLTHLRYFGHNFNPATFYYCYDEKDTRVETIIVEIHNTPWGEVFCYVLGEDKNEGSLNEKRYRLHKEFHVSPFIDMGMDYDWTFTVPGESLKVHMIDFDQGQRFFEAELTLSKREISAPALRLMLMQYPFVTVKVVAAIYWQALRLLIKGAKFYTHPDKKSREGA
ncbi:MAG: DUF1365 domain-containing protein [Nitrospirota bacterium]|nr:DUF1365 domain-containing protein [Nitrospirota bacterium]